MQYYAVSLSVLCILILRDTVLSHSLAMPSNIRLPREEFFSHSNFTDLVYGGRKSAHTAVQKE